MTIRRYERKPPTVIDADHYPLTRREPEQVKRPPPVQADQSQPSEGAQWFWALGLAFWYWTMIVALLLVAAMACMAVTWWTA